MKSIQRYSFSLDKTWNFNFKFLHCLFLFKNAQNKNDITDQNSVIWKSRSKKNRTQIRSNTLLNAIVRYLNTLMDLAHCAFILECNASFQHDYHYLPHWSRLVVQAKFPTIDRTYIFWILMRNEPYFHVDMSKNRVRCFT